MNFLLFIINIIMIVIVINDVAGITALPHNMVFVEICIYIC